MNDHPRRPRPDIVAPAGTPAKLRTALHFGADAVYLGLRQFSMRSFAGNFDYDALEWALAYAHERGRRVYVAVNIQPLDSDFAGIEEVMRRLAQLGPDAVIVGDPGVMGLAHRSGLPVHLSTQMSVTNAPTANYWFSQGIRRIVVARELHLSQLSTLVGGVTGEVEAFAHGAVCIAYSGRCLLSLYWANRDPRRGECAQACRWRFRAIEDRRRPGEPNPIEQDERGSYFFDAKDLCTIPVLGELLGTGVSALKIEGRTRSPHYLAVVVDVYRRASEQLAAGDVAGFEADKERYLTELSRAAYRPFSTHFLTGDQDRDETYVTHGAGKNGVAHFLGEVLANDGDSLRVALANPIRPGSVVEVRDAGMLVEPVHVARVLGPDGGELDFGRGGAEIRVVGRFRAGPGAIVRSAEPEIARPEPNPPVPGSKDTDERRL